MKSAFINLHVHFLLEQRALYKMIMLHFRAVILMSLNKDLYSYHLKIFKGFPLNSVKTNRIVHVLVEQRFITKFLLILSLKYKLSSQKI